MLVFAATTATGEIPPPHRLVNAPTAGTLPARSFVLETHLFEDGGVAQLIGVGLLDVVDVGVSFSGIGIIGSEPVRWQPHAAFQGRIRIIEESMVSPALAIGFDSQGEGAYVSGKNLNRFRTKSKGAYCVASRNYRFLGNLGLHGGVNYSFEDNDGDRDPSFWAGADKTIGPMFEVCAEYDFATNDNENRSITYNRGYLNGAVRMHIGGSFILEFDLRNILRNEKKGLAGNAETLPEPSRELRIYYRGMI